MVLQNITYENTDTGNATAGIRTIDFTVDDGDGDTSLTHSATVDVASPNDAPVLTSGPGGGTHNEGSSGTYFNNGLTISDADSADFDGGVLTTTITGNGETGDRLLILDGGNVTVVGSTIRYDFGGGPVDVASFTGGDGTNSLVVTFNSSADAIAVEAVAQQVAYRTEIDDPSTLQRTLTMDVSDGDGGTSGTVTRTMNVVGDNDAPSVTVTGDSPSFTEDGPAQTLFSGAVIDSVEAGDLISSMVFTVSGLADGSDELLVVDGLAVQLTDLNSVTTVSNSYDVDISVVGSTATVTVSKTGGFSDSDAETLLNTLAYNNTSENPATNNRLVEFVSITDDGGGTDTTSDGTTSTVSVVSNNEGPAFSNLDNTPSFTEDGSAQVLDADVTIFDEELTAIDDFSGASISVVRSSGGNAEDLFSATGNMVFNAGTVELSSVPVGTYTQAGGLLTIAFGAGTTNSEVNEVLQSIAYENTSHDPPNSISLDWAFDDGNSGSQGSGGAIITTATQTVNIQAVNDAPINTVPVNAVVTEEVATAISGISVSDVDDQGANVSTSLSVANGTLDVTLSGSASITAGSNSSGSMTLTGSVADINATLASLIYTGDLNVSGVAADSLTIVTDDLGNTGTGGALQDSDVVQIDITTVEDVPITGNTTVAATEDAAYTLQTSDFPYFDGDGDPLDHIQITELPSGGTLTLSGGAVALGDTISAADIAAGNLVYTPTPDGFGPGYDDFGFRVSDGSDYSTETSSVSVFNADFESGLDGFAYVDDYFGTSQPGNANGVLDWGGGESGSDGLRIDLGRNAGGQASSGAFTQSINVIQDGVYRFTLDYRLAVASQLDTGEWGEAILEINGARYGSDLNNSLAHIEGGGDTGWQSTTVELFLTAGSHTISLGGYVNQSNANNERVEVYFDNVVVDELIHNTVSVDVAGTADAPVLDNTGSMTLTPVLEDTTDSDPVGDTVAAIIASAGGDRITDVDGDPEGIAVTAVDNSNGVWYYSTNGGVSWSSFAGDGVSTGAPDDGNAVVLDATAMVKFVPVGDFNGNAGDITFRAWDTTDGSTSGDSGIDVSVNGGGTAFSTSMETASITVTPQNDDSVITLSGSISYVEDAAPALLAPTGTVVDIDGLDFDTGTLSVNLTSGGTIDDQLAIQAVGDGTGEVNISGADVLYEGVVIGTYTGVVDGLSPMVVTFNANADQIAVEAVLQSVNFASVDHDPTVSRTFEITLTDGDGGSVNVSESIAITPVNDAPSVNSLAGDSVIVANNATIVSLDPGSAAVISDPDNPVDLSGGSLQVVGNSFDVSDQIRIDTSGNVAVSPSYADGATISVSGVSIGTLSGVSDGGLILSLNSDATVARVEEVIQSFTFSSTSSNFGARTVDFILIDGDGTANGGNDTSVSTVNVFVSNGANGLVTTDEDTDYTITATDFDFTGITGSNLQSITITGLPVGGDLLLNGSIVNVNDTITKADIDAGLLEFSPDQDGNGLLYSSFDFYVNSGVSTVNILAGENSSYTLNGGSLLATDQILADGSNFGPGGTVSTGVSVVNTSTTIDAAYLAQGEVFFNGFVPDANWTAPELSALNTWVQAGGVLISTGDATSYDAVNEYYGLTTINSGNTVWHVADDSSPLMNGPFGLVGNNGDSFNAAGTISYFDSASLAVGDQVLATDSISGEPTMVLRAHGSGFILFTSDEGIFRANMTGGGSVSTANDILAANIFAWATSQVPASETHTVDVSVNAINDDPFDNGAMPSDVNVTEDVLSNLDLSGVDIMDVDEASGNMTVTLTAGAGSLFSADAGGVAVTVIDPQTIQLDGTMADLNAFLDIPSNIQYLGVNNVEGNDADTITFEVSDNGNSGSGGGGQVNFGTINVDIAAVNDEEVLVNNTGQTIDENDSFIFTTSHLETTDVENGAGGITYTINTDVSSGTLLLDGSTVLDATDTFTQADIDSGRVSYQNDGSETTSDSFNFIVDDGVGASTTGTFSFNINPINDAPELDNSGTPTLDFVDFGPITGMLHSHWLQAIT